MLLETNKNNKKKKQNSLETQHAQPSNPNLRFRLPVLKLPLKLCTVGPKNPNPDALKPSALNYRKAYGSGFRV